MHSGYVHPDFHKQAVEEARKQGAADKIAYGRASFENGRKQGAAEERAAANVICDEMWCEDGMDHYTIEAIRKRLKARGAAEPVCYCNHYPPGFKCKSCEGKPPEPAPMEPCHECGGDWDGPHKAGCLYCMCGDCVKAREPKPLSLPKNDSKGELFFALIATIDHVNRIEARGRP